MITTKQYKIYTGETDASDLLWSANTSQYPRTMKKTSHKLNLMINQCQRMVEKEEPELAELLKNIQTTNNDYMGFVDNYLLKQSNYQMLDKITEPARLPRGWHSFVRSLDREQLFSKTFAYMTEMRSEIFNYGVLSAPNTSRTATIPFDTYQEAYNPLLNAMESMTSYFYPTAEDAPEKE